MKFADQTELFLVSSAEDISTILLTSLANKTTKPITQTTVMIITKKDAINHVDISGKMEETATMIINAVTASIIGSLRLFTKLPYSFAICLTLIAGFSDISLNDCNAFPLMIVCKDFPFAIFSRFLKKKILYVYQTVRTISFGTDISVRKRAAVNSECFIISDETATLMHHNNSSDS